MTVNEYLKAVLKSQTIASESAEYKELTAKADEVKGILKKAFEGAAFTTKYGGSRAKHTMIRESYDLDIVCYFERDENQAGETLAEIYESVKVALSEHYYVDPKTSALRLEEGNQHVIYTHVDVVPGRFIDETKTDTYLYQNGSDKQRLKTNTKVHVECIRDSGVTDTIKLLKLWREKWLRDVHVKTFVLELLAVKVLTDHKTECLENQLVKFWETLRDEKTLCVVDPANSNNDLSEALNSIKSTLQYSADNTLRTIDVYGRETVTGWENVFGKLDETPSDAQKAALINSIPNVVTQGTKPWSFD